ncbi:MAG: hypothetical protein K0S76_1432 [Herbinix sp.]|nr:hypothetical protein [Herbinix sp.]
MVKKIILVFKTHFDIGFTDLSSKVIEKYANSMLKEVIATCKATEHMGRQKYVWTMPSWPLKIITEQCDTQLKKELDYLIENDQIVWHALPFTSHTDFCSAEEYIEGLRFGRILSETYHKPYPISAKMTDVPGHGIMLPAILNQAGVKFLHLGCNEFASPPKVPFLFQWEAKSGERILTMYSKGGYGTSLLPPDTWEYPVWMALMQTSDNCGPQSAAVIEKMVKSIHKKYPEAEVVCGTMDEFYKELAECDLSTLPVITKDLADTWIHGVGAYPKEVGILREDREKSRRLQALYAKKVLEEEKNQDGAMEVLDRYYENISLFEEHTWGADVKTWLGPDRVYRKKDFIKAKQTEKYRFMEASWQEQRDRATQSNKALSEMKLLLEKNNDNEILLFNPNSSEFTGWVKLGELNIDFVEHGLQLAGDYLPMTRIDGEWSCYVKNLPTFVTVSLQIADKQPATNQLVITEEDSNIRVENHRYSLKFSAITGSITEIFDKKLETVLLQERNHKSVFSYQYDRYGIEEVTTYLKDYAYRFSTWGIQDYGREAYPECKHKTYHPKFKCYSIENDTVLFHYEGSESTDRYGDAKQIKIEVTLPPEGDELFVGINLSNKQETPYIESGSILFPVAGDDHQFLINKSNAVLDPEKDIEVDANHVFYCLENYISTMKDNIGLCIITKDSPLVSLGNTGIYKYQNDYKTPEEPIIYFNLFNNMWGTNFPQWIQGDLSYRYILYGYDKADQATVTERAAALKEGIEITHNHLAKEIGKFPEHMQLVNARKEGMGIVLRFKDLAGAVAFRKLRVEGYSITPVDFHNQTVGKSVPTELEFAVKPFGIYSFLITK